MNYQKEALRVHAEQRGKIEVVSKVAVESKDDLSIAYTPGVAEPCREIAKNKEDVYKYTAKGNLVAVVSDGSAVLGLGNIGPEASMPVMEGKAILFKTFANVDAFPLCLSTQDVDEIVETVVRVAPTFGGINLEDISSPRCVAIERKLKEQLSIPIFHDDQHGTAIVVSAAFINACTLTNREMGTTKVVINGAGAAGNAIAEMLRNLGVNDIVVCDRKGILTVGDSDNNFVQEELANWSNPRNLTGTLADALVGADCFIGVSAKDCVSKEMVEQMSEKSMVFPMANPDPEIMPDMAKAGGAYIVGTGRSDFPNQINNVLAFPGIFRGALDIRATSITEAMKVAAAYAIAALVEKEDLDVDYIIPSALDERVAKVVAEAVKEAYKA